MRIAGLRQCHVEYYFRGQGNYLTFPWDEGTAPEQIEAYYDAQDFTDWTHAISEREDGQDAASGLRGLQRGHPRLSQRRVRRLPHALQDRGRGEVHRPPRAKPAVEHRQQLRGLPPLERGGDSRPRRGHPGQGPRGTRPGRSGARPGTLRHRRGQAGRGDGRGTRRRRENWSARPNCAGTTWPPTTAWASTRRRSA